jgi:guanylate kinase
MTEIQDIRGHLVLVMAPMGSGKGSLVSHVREVFPQLTHTISCTTREKRPQEVHGTHYYFLTREEFQTRIEKEEFIEWAEFGGNLYGTLKSELIGRLQNGEVVICEIEVQGILQMLNLIPHEYKTLIYIEAGDWEVLKQRALARAPMSEVELGLRYERFLEEVTHKELADIIVYNRDGQLEEAKTQMEAIMREIIAKTDA